MVVEGVVWGADDYAGGDLMAVNDYSTGQYLARQNASNGRRKSHCFIDAGVEVSAGV